MGLEKREMPVNGPRMVQEREKVLSGIYTHGAAKALGKRPFFAMCRIKNPKWTIHNNFGQFAPHRRSI